MKSVELTEKHKSKLLEMCKVLFPEYNEWRFGKVTAEGNIEDFYQKSKNLSWEEKEKYEQSCDFIWIEKDFKYKHDDDIERSETWVIHWFEFVCTHLIKKLQSSLPKDKIWRNQPKYVSNIFDWKDGNKWTLYSEFFFHYPKNMNKMHPVDYLYEEFKKL